MSFIVHTVADVNQQLARGNSFFRDVITEGITLHDAGRLAIAAFELHQIAETLHKVVLLLFTAYLPKTYDLAKLGRTCAQACPDLGPLVPHDAPDRKRLAALIRAAYIDARYSLAFGVSRQDLEVLAGHIRGFRVRGARACQARLASLAAAARAALER